MGLNTCGVCSGTGITTTSRTIRDSSPGGTTHRTVSENTMCAACGGTGSIYVSDPTPKRKPEKPNWEPRGSSQSPEKPNSKTEEADSRAVAITAVLVFLVATGYLINDGMEWGSALLSGFFIGLIGGYFWKLVWGVIIFGVIVWVYGALL